MLGGLGPFLPGQSAAAITSGAEAGETPDSGRS